MALNSYYEAFLNAGTRLFVAALGATPTWAEIPIASITPKTNKTKRDLTTNANRATDGTLYAASANTQLAPTVECKTKRFSDGAATPALLGALQLIEDAGQAMSPDDYLQFLVAPTGGQAYTATFSIDEWQGWGGEVNTEAEFTWSMTQQGAPTDYTSALPE